MLGIYLDARYTLSALCAGARMAKTLGMTTEHFVDQEIST
jgi:hypothetical protein